MNRDAKITTSKSSRHPNVEDQQRQSWSSGLEFLMSCISVSVGLGNIWRFPFTAYENGGGAFLVPYIVVLFLIGKPMYYLEVLLGQFTSRSSLKIWSVCPSFIGVGVGQAYAGITVLTYYSSLLAITLYYLIASFQKILPWSYCRDEWETNCVDSKPKSNATYQTKPQSSSELYFVKTVIHEYDDISEGIGLPDWRLTLALFISWLTTFLVIVKGVKTAGKAAYFLAIFPYVILITLLVRAVTLDGAIDGIIYFLKPNWSEYGWKLLCNVFSHWPWAWDRLLCFHRTINLTTTHTADNLNVEVDEVVRSGTGLAFISYPDAIAKFEAAPQLFSVLFFAMFYVLGIGTLVAQANTLVAILCDQYKWMDASIVSLITTVGGFLCGIVYVTPAGQWILNLVDYYGATFVIFGLALFQICGISWVYGLQNFCDDIEYMTNRPVSFYWRICWSIITPFLLLSIFIYSMAELKTITYAGMEYPKLANFTGWLLLAIGFIQFPLWFLWTVYTHYEGTFWKSVKKACRPDESWGPSDQLIRKDWLLYKNKIREDRKAKVLDRKTLHFWQKLVNVFSKNG
ncbi:hypothetical protein GQX74_007759 [Glossina fuscipes]|nr:hypothetical protein GQX74_007759 [Glossina fuscipes]